MVPSYAGGSIREGTPLYPAGGPWTEHSQLSSSNAYNAHAFESPRILEGQPPWAFSSIFR